MSLEIRKFAKSVDRTYIEGNKRATIPVELISVAAVITNPWFGKGFVENLRPEILKFAPELGNLLVDELILYAQKRWDENDVILFSFPRAFEWCKDL